MTRVVETNHLKADYIVEGSYLSHPPHNMVLMDDPRAECYERSYGFTSEALTKKFIDSSVRLAGAGGGGLALAVILAKKGVGDFSIADPEQVEISNVGRIPFLTYDHVGMNKAEVAAKLVTAHNPMAKVRVYTEGIQEDNLKEFIEYDSGKNGEVIAIDEIEIRAPLVALRFHRQARKSGKFVISATDVEYGGMVTTYNPTDLKNTYERSMGAKLSDSEKEFLKKVRRFHLPVIANAPTTGSIKALKAALREDIPLPTDVEAVLIATALAVDEYRRILSLDDERYADPHFSPEVHCSNPSHEEDFVSKRPRIRSSVRIAKAVLRDVARLNPPVDYSVKDIARRAQFRSRAARYQDSDID